MYLLITVLGMAVVVIAISCSIRWSHRAGRAQADRASETVQYDAEVIRLYAAALYSRATTITIAYALAGAVVGGIVGIILGSLGLMGADPPTLGLALALVGAVFGYFSGAGRAFRLRLEAQLTLCQAQIEANTCVIKKACQAWMRQQQTREEGSQ